MDKYKNFCKLVDCYFHNQFKSKLKMVGNSYLCAERKKIFQTSENCHCIFILENGKLENFNPPKIVERLFKENEYFREPIIVLAAYQKSFKKLK